VVRADGVSTKVPFSSATVVPEASSSEARPAYWVAEISYELVMAAPELAVSSPCGEAEQAARPPARVTTMSGRRRMERMTNDS
jgi:hypothetical protein